MYIEDEYIQKQFKENFLSSDFKNIVIYGTGVHTQKLLENIDDSRIVGLMDSKRTGEMLWGKMVLSYDEVSVLPDVGIVIIARNAVINVIYRRIEKFASVNGIKVFDINGNLLGSSDKCENQDCFLLDKKQLMSKLEKAEVISFDIFDTLLCRRVLRPVDVFKVMDRLLKNEGYIFSEERKRAEAELPEGGNPNIHEIYSRLQGNLKLGDEKLHKLLNLEIETEINFLRRRDEMCDMLEKAADMGKRVILISDMYMTRDILRDILSHFGIKRYEKLYVSCEYGTGKSEKLFDVAGDELGTDKSKWLHIGDNVYTDIFPAEKLGIDTFQIYSTTELLERSVYSRLLEYNDSLEENIVIAYFAAEAFNNPFGTYGGNGKLKLTSVDEVSGLLIAPVAFKFVNWLIRHAISEGIETIVFPSRDGFVLKKIYEHIKKTRTGMHLPGAIYLYTSRRAALVAAAKTEKDVRFIIDVPSSTARYNRMVERFDLDEAEMVQYMPYSGADDDFEAPVQLLLEKSAVEREMYLKYLKDKLDGCGKKLALVDFISIGTVQKALQKLLGMELTGFYFLHRSPDAEEDEVKCESLYDESGDFENSSNLYRYYYFLETVFSSYEPTFKKIGLDGKKKFFTEKRSKEILEKLKRMHNVIVAYAEEMNKLIPDVDSLTADKSVYDELLGFLSVDSVDVEIGVLDGFINYDEFMGKTVTDLNR